MPDMDHFLDLPYQERRWANLVLTLPQATVLSAAYTFARDAHATQTRKGSPALPYIIHPMRVALALIEEYRIDDAAVIAAALLHDVVEDCGVAAEVIRREFGGRVGDLVAELTWPRDRMAMWERAVALPRASHAVRMVKAADIIDNLRDLGCTASVPRPAVLRSVYGYARWGRALLTTLDARAQEQFTEALAVVRRVHGGDDGALPLPPNPEKECRIVLPDGVSVDRYPVRTHLVRPADEVLALVRQYAIAHCQWGDLLAISERVVAITQGRAYPLAEIHPSWWANFLVRFVHKSKYGIGLGSPWTMELAIREAGLPRMCVAAFAAAMTKPLGIRGVFYRVVGKHINAIDGPCDYTLPIADSDTAGKPTQGSGYAKLGPKDPDGVAQRIAREIGVDVAIIDANDLGVNVLGASDGVDRAFVAAAFRDNPLGQTNEQTPMAIVRRATSV
ncbi:HD domain-containing protein [Candidatus Uhrbacteria bacterium]|nr:HD domain-containing protein [Candidatus Uhrbacteria bacterium]